MVETDPLRVLVWSEGTAVGDVYPQDINGTIATYLNGRNDIVAETGSIDDEDQGVPQSTLDRVDAVVWWGHLKHDDVTDETVERIVDGVESGSVGFIALHSAHYARPFTELIGASGDLGDVRTVDGETERIVVNEPDHPLARGIDDFALPQVEMFGEPFDIPSPESAVLTSTFSEGGTFRSGVTFTIGAGRVVYLRPGHEEFRIYHDQNVRRLIDNAVRWVADR